MITQARLAVRAAAAGALMSAGLAGCTGVTSGQAAGAPAPACTRVAAAATTGAPVPGGCQGRPVTVYVIAGNWVVPIRTATGVPGRKIPVGADPAGAVPVAVAVTPDSKTAYVISGEDGAVIPISVATGKPGPALGAGNFAEAIAITPDGTTAYVSNEGSGTVTPIRIATATPGSSIPVGPLPGPITITP